MRFLGYKVLRFKVASLLGFKTNLSTSEPFSKQVNEVRVDKIVPEINDL